MIARLVFLSGALVCVAFAPAYGQGLLQSEIMVVDQACIERKVIQCLSIGHEEGPGFSPCPDGTVKSGKGGQEKCLTLGPGVFAERYLKSTTEMKPDQVMTEKQAREFKNDVIDIAKHRERIEECRLIAESFPSAFGGQNCLRPLAEERTLNALTIELRDLVGQLCHLAKHPDCVDDAVPAESTAATQDNPAPTAAAP